MCVIIYFKLFVILLLFLLSFFFNIARKNIVSWDQQIKSLCLQVNRMFEVLYNDPPTRDWMDNYYENQANN